MVAVVTPDSVLIASGVRDIENRTPLKGLIGPAHLAGRGHRVKWRCRSWLTGLACNRAISPIYRRRAD
jgi:hypothetical protein